MKLRGRRKGGERKRKDEGKIEKVTKIKKEKKNKK